MTRRRVGSVNAQRLVVPSQWQSGCSWDNCPKGAQSARAAQVFRAPRPHALPGNPLPRFFPLFLTQYHCLNPEAMPTTDPTAASSVAGPALPPWCGAVQCGAVRCGAVWCGVVWCGVVWCGVVWCGVVWCGVVWCGVVWCGVVWCGVVWCGGCGVVWCGSAHTWCGGLNVCLRAKRANTRLRICPILLSRFLCVAS